MYGFAEFFEVTDPISNTVTFVIVMPHLGETNLEKLLQLPQTTQLIPLREWLNLFVRITLLVDAFHKNTSYMHDDIKPANIGLTVKFCEYGKWLVFTQGNILDFGNAHHPDKLAMLGDKRYQPPEAFTSAKRTLKVDVFTLGKSFLEALSIIGNQFNSSPEDVPLSALNELLARMTAPKPADRPELSVVLNELIHIIHNYDDVLSKL